MTRAMIADALRGRLPVSPDGAAIAPAVEPMDETALAREIARVMERRMPAPPRPPVMTVRCARWLGDEADRAVVEAYLASTEPAKSTQASDVGARKGRLSVQFGYDTAVADAAIEPAKPAYASGTAAQWVRQARRDRWRSKLRDAAGWSVSLTVSLILVVAVGLAMYGWPDAPATLERLLARKPVNVSTLQQPVERVAQAAKPVQGASRSDMTAAGGVR